MARTWLLGLALVVAVVAAPQPPRESVWAPLSFLLGNWIAEGGGQPGQGTGAFSFAPELRGRILVRKNRADYPATKDPPATSHEDLMIVYRDDAARRLRAVYFDNEAHVIHYSVEALKNGAEVLFLSDLVPSTPRFRLSYRKTGDDTMVLKFEIAPPGKPESFSTYLEGTARRGRGK